MLNFDNKIKYAIFSAVAVGATYDADKLKTKIIKYGCELLKEQIKIFEADEKSK